MIASQCERPLRDQTASGSPPRMGDEMARLLSGHGGGSRVSQEGAGSMHRQERRGDPSGHNINAFTGSQAKAEELLILLLETTFQRDQAKLIAAALLDHFGSLSTVVRAPPRQLLGFLFGREDAVSLLGAVAHIAHQLVLNAIEGRPLLASNEQVQNYLRFSFQQDGADDAMRVLFLDRHNCLIKELMLSRGRTDDPRPVVSELVRRMAQLDAVAIVVARFSLATNAALNSRDAFDERFTKQLRTGLKIVRAVLHSYLVVGPTSCVDLVSSGVV